MKAGGALLHQPFLLLVPSAPECRLTLGETIGGVWLTLDGLLATFDTAGKFGAVR
jgi:hypothetical protein